nr:recombinase family protein [uncultured Anaerocolumna sp.]
MAYNVLRNNVLPPGEYGMYLRKSRKDIEAESQGEGETLKRHEENLLRLAEKYNITISEKNIFREVVSGETIDQRPEVQNMLNLVTEGKLTGVFVMEIERIARGDTSDQGAVAKAFKYNNTLIITPAKIYDPNDEADEEYFEFGLFMSRREYKTINRRLQRGRIAAVSEGLYLASTPPYGYNKVKIHNDKGYTLEIIPDQAVIVQSIYEWHAIGVQQEDGSILKLGATRIADRLNQMGVKPLRSQYWTKSSIIDILRNPVYAGMIRWGYKKEEKFIKDNKVRKQRRKGDEYHLVKGKHEAIISMELYNTVQDILANRRHASVPGNTVLKYPFTGIIYCGKCGRLMTRLAKSNKTPYDTIKCMNKQCNNVSSPLYLVEDVIITSMQQWLNDFTVKWEYEKLNNPYSSAIQLQISVINQAKNDHAKLSAQRERLYTLVEQGAYSVDIFVQRNKKLTNDIEALEETIQKCEQELNRLRNQESYNDFFISNAQRILDQYYELDTATAKNEALKEILEKVEYVKDKPNKKGDRDNKNFKIELFPKVIQF